MGRKAITYRRVLEELNRERYWTFGPITDNMQDKITLKEFRKTMMFNDITTSERKVRELWQLMEDLDFFHKINQSDVRIIDLAAVAKAIGVEVVSEKYLASKTREQQSEEGVSIE